LRENQIYPRMKISDEREREREKEGKKGSDTQECRIKENEEGLFARQTRRGGEMRLVRSRDDGIDKHRPRPTSQDKVDAVDY
jgi:hypothetical protein